MAGNRSIYFRHESNRKYYHPPPRLGDVTQGRPLQARADSISETFFPASDEENESNATKENNTRTNWQNIQQQT